MAWVKPRWATGGRSGPSGCTARMPFSIQIVIFSASRAATVHSRRSGHGGKSRAFTTL